MWPNSTTVRMVHSQTSLTIIINGKKVSANFIRMTNGEKPDDIYSSALVLFIPECLPQKLFFRLPHGEFSCSLSPNFEENARFDHEPL